MEDIRTYRENLLEPAGAETAFFRAMVPVTQVATLFHLGRVERGEHPFIFGDLQIHMRNGAAADDIYHTIDEQSGIIAGQINDAMMQSTVQLMPALEPYWKTPFEQRYEALRQDPQLLQWLRTADEAGAPIDRGEIPSGMIVSGIRVGINTLVCLAMLHHHPSGQGKGIDAARAGQIISATDGTGLSLVQNDLFIADLTGDIAAVADPQAKAGISNALRDVIAVRGAPGCPARKPIRKEVIDLLDRHGLPVSKTLRMHSPIQSLGMRVRDHIDGLFRAVTLQVSGDTPSRD